MVDLSPRNQTLSPARPAPLIMSAILRVPGAYPAPRGSESFACQIERLFTPAEYVHEMRSTTVLMPNFRSVHEEWAPMETGQNVWHVALVQQIRFLLLDVQGALETTRTSEFVGQRCAHHHELHAQAAISEIKWVDV
eukprot:GFKZ01013045.1.p3 GENE.GFKZ01013045.1~~GFKZ01013045.1.p3  ORF type:complete len:137 (-),score=0.53 GFKZ01013045.1:328-738(-)